MFMAFAIILAIAWILGFGVFHVASAAIHVLGGCRGKAPGRLRPEQEKIDSGPRL
jgi:hypothetical protein